MTKKQKLVELQAKWESQWPAALKIWSRFVKLKDPVWCLNKAMESKEQLTGSFAMIRLNDHAIVIGMEQVLEKGLGDFALEILAHEIGHHVYCPADLSDNARLTARIRRGIPTKEHLSPFISNLYSDLLINNRLQREHGLDIAVVYRKLVSECPDSLWTLYMRIYELLWSLPTGELANGKISSKLNQDAMLGSRLIRSYAKDWLDGAGRFAALCLPYLIDDEAERMQKCLAPWLDTRAAGHGALPEGMASIDEYEIEGAIHPSEDPELSGLEGGPQISDADLPQEIGVSGMKSDKGHRGPIEYTEVLRASGVDIDETLIIANYYRERAVPHLISFPTVELPVAVDPIPEGLEMWDVGDPIEDVDWFGTMLSGDVVIPGVTTRQRVYGNSLGDSPDRLPVDLYLGVDCSGSMNDPSRNLSYPVLAGAIIALSALRTGSKVKVALSGEPGRTVTTDDFENQSSRILKVLTDYLGSGYAFGIHRLRETFDDRPDDARPCHILIVSDNDTFRMLDSEADGIDGWTVAARALEKAKGGGTFVLELPEDFVGNDSRGEYTRRYTSRMEAIGWNVAVVASMEQLLEFARAFSRQKYEFNKTKR